MMPLDRDELSSIVAFDLQSLAATIQLELLLRVGLWNGSFRRGAQLAIAPGFRDLARDSGGLS